MVSKKWFLVGLGLAVMAAALAMPEMVMAQNTLGTAAGNLKTEATEFGSLAEVVFLLVGFVMTGGGVLKVIKDKEARQPIGPGVGVALAGFILISLATFSLMGSASIFSGDANQDLDTIGVGG